MLIALSSRRWCVSSACALLLLLSSVAAWAQSSSTATSAAGTTAPADPDGGWPRSMTTPSGSSLVMYQPQIQSWDGQANLVAMAAMSYLAKGGSTPQLGTIKLKSPTSVAMEERLVSLTKVEIAEINFSTLSRDQSQDVTHEIQSVLPTAPLVISLDRVLAMVDKSQISGKGVQVNTAPPPIYYSEKPAILVQFDGDPILSAIDGTTLKYVVNTNWDVFQDTASKLWYLRNDTYWLQTADPKGAWTPVQKLPADFSKLPTDANWTDARANIPGKKIDKNKMPTVFCTQTPSELILVDGAPKTTPVTGTSLLWVNNTDSDVFRMNGGATYFLVSGRWFSAAQMTGPWTFASASLPPDFKNIPTDHPRASVLSSVPGTDQAAEAVLLAQVPTTAKVDAKNLKAPEVKYSGDPQFVAIEGSSVTYASNASYDVLKVGSSYYLCTQAVWFISSTPTGPWVVTTSVPQAIYAMPASSPVYNVTYVVVVNPDPYYPVYAYYPGYMGVTVSYGCVMYGTGYYYPPYYHYPPYGAPIYYPRPVSYGCGATYNPYTGAYGYHQSAYGPYGGVSSGASYNPYTGTYKRGAVAYGPAGASGYGQAYNPRTGAYGQTKQGSNAYGSWGSSSVQRGDQWAQSQHTTDANGNTKWSAQGSGGGSAAGWSGSNGGNAVKTGSGDVYAGKDGNVYKKTDSGWQSYSGGGSGSGGWSDVNGSQPKSGQTSASGAKTSASGGAASSASGASGASGAKASASGGAAGAASGAAGAGASHAAPSSDTMSQLNHDSQTRSQGNQRAQSSAGAASSGGGGRSGGGRRR